MFGKIVKDSSLIAISYVDHLQFGEFRNYVTKENMGFIEIAVRINSLKVLYISFDADAIISKIELGDGKKYNRIILMSRSYTGIFSINEPNLKNLDNDNLNYYIDYYNTEMKPNNRVAKEMIRDLQILLKKILNQIKYDNKIFFINFQNADYVWHEKQVENADVDFLNRCLEVNQWKNLFEKTVLHQIYSSEIAVLPPDIRPDTNPNYCVVQTSVGCKVKDIRGKACKFCNSFQKVKYRECDSEEVERQVRKLKVIYPKTISNSRICFFADGDAISATNFLSLVSRVKSLLPNIKAFESFISTYTILNMPKEKWKDFIGSGLSCVYWGVESADNETLKFLDKPQTERLIFEAREILEKQGIPYAMIVLCGLSKINNNYNNLYNHVEKTCNFINDSKCKKIYISKLNVIPGSKLYEEMENRAFIPMSQEEIDEEFRIMIGNLNKNVNGAYGNQFIL